MGLSLKKRLTDNFLTRGASRAFDQVNPLDNNRTWQQTTPTQSKSRFQQAGQLTGQTARAVGGATAKTLNTVGAGLSQVPATIRGEVAMRTGNQKALDNALVAQKNMREQVYGSQNSGILGKGTIYKSVDDYLNPDINSSNPIDDIVERTRRFSGLGAESALEVASLGVGGVAGKELVKQGVKQGLKTQAPKIAGNAVLNTTQGGINAYNQGGSAKDIAKSALISGTVGTVADVGLGIAGAGLSKTAKSQIKPVEAFYDPKLPKPKVELKAPDQIKAAQKQTLESIVDKPKVSLKEKNNLGDALNMDRFKNPKAVDLPKLDTTTQVGKLSDDDMVNQMVNDLGVSEKTARKLIAENNKPALATNLYGSKELIRNANNSDAYATKVMSEAQKRSGQAAKQNMPVVTLKENPTVKVGNDTVDAVTGEVIEPVTKESTFAKQLKEAYARTEKEFQELDKRVGFGEDEIREKMIRAARGDYKLTSTELEASKFYTDRLNLAKAMGEQNGLVVKGDQKLYTPQAKKGRVGQATTVDEVMDFGYNKSRKNAIELDEMDYSKDPQVDYVVKAENRPLIIQKAVDDAAQIDGRIVPEENVVQVADKIQQLQKKVHDSSKSAKVLTNDTVTDLNDIGRLEGYEQKTIDYSPGAIVQEPKVMLENAGIYKNGFEQYENAAGYGNEFARQVKEYGLSPEQTIEGLEKSIQKSMPDADNSAVNSAVANARRRLSKEGLSPEDAAHVYQSAFKNVAKSELFRLGKTTVFSNSKLKKVVNEQINTRLMIDAWNKNAAQNLDSFIAERINVSLRGLNIVSALFEMGDIANIYSKYGFDDVVNSKFGFGKIDGDSLHYSHKYGQNSPHYLSADIPEISKFNQIIDNPNMSNGKKVYEMYRTAENKLLFFKYIEQHKTEMFFRAAEADYMKKGLRGTELVNAVMEDYYKTMLPHSVLTANRIVGKFPKVMTQYLNWSLQATKRMGRTLSGSDEGGAFAGKTRAERVARGIGTEIVPKVAAAAILGVPIMQVLGMRDLSGATEGDFSGISDEDKIAADYAVDALSVSPILGVASNFYFADRRNDIAQQKAEQGETYGVEPRESDKPANVAKDSAKMLIPFQTQYNKSKQVIDASRKGYYENKDGKIQAEGPKGAEKFMGWFTGKNYTPTFREYQDNPNIVSVLQGKNKPQDLIVKNETVSNVVQSLGGESTRDYKRPLNQEYSDAFKAVDKSLRTSMLDGGRKYNAVLDDLKRNDRNAYDNYITSMDGNHVSPEYWKQLTGGSAGSDVDLKLFNSVKARKQQLYNDMTKAGQNKDGKYNIDPLYSLKDEQARQVLQMKSTATGDDLALRNILYKEKWYTDYINKQSEYYNNKPEGPESDYESTPRVKEWYKHNDAYNALTGVTGDTLQKSYPLVWQLKQYKYGSEESKSFLKNNYDAWKAQSDALDSSKLALINKMRNIEGYDPMSFDAYAQAIEIADTSDTAGSSGGSGGGFSSKKDKTPTAEYTKVAQASPLKVVSLKGNSPEIRTKKSVKRRPRPKLQIKKSMV